MFRILLLAPALLVGLAQANHWHALVVGANLYHDARFDTLDGAVNDAQIIADALKNQGVHPQVLLNDKARYDTIHAWWQTTIKQAKAGDTVFFSFAGHGAQEAEHFPGTELANARADDPDQNVIDDGLDEVLLLPGYQDAGKASMERIVDQEILGWAHQATQKGARVFVVADACYAGGLTRSALSGRDYGDTLTKTRNGGASVIQPSDRTVRSTEASAILRTSDKAAFESRLFYAVPFANEQDKVLEIILDGKPHGALSFLMAQALAGQAQDKQGKQVQTLAQLRKFLQEKSRELTENGQEASLAGVDRENKDSSFLPQAAALIMPPKAKAPALFANKDCPKLSDVAGLFTLANEPKAADFRWHCSDGTVIRTGVVTVAYDITTPTEVQAFFRQQILLRAIEAIKLPRFAAGIRVVQAQPGQDVTVFEEGDKVAIEFAAPKGFDTLIAFNFPAAGGIQVINAAPIPSLKHLSQTQGKDNFDTLLGETIVTPPFGNDHLLLLAVHNDALSQSPFLRAVMKDKTLQQGSSGDELLLDMEALSNKQAALAIVPFTSVRTAEGR